MRRDRGSIATGIGTSEEIVSAPDSWAAMEPFDDPVVDRKVPVIEVALQGLLIELISKCGTSGDFGGSIVWSTTRK